MELLNWFLEQTLNNQIAFVVGFFTIIGIVATIYFQFKKQPTPPLTNNSANQSNNNIAVTGDGNSVTQDNSTTIINQSDPEIPAILAKIFENQQASAQEKQSLNQIIEELFASQDSEKQKVKQCLEQNDIESAINKLNELNNIQSSHFNRQKQQVFETKTQLAALLYYSDSSRSAQLLKEALEIKPDDAETLNTYGILLQRIGKATESITILSIC